MGKVKSQMMQEQEEEFELDLSYGEWLMENESEPSAVEIMDMARDVLSPATFSQMYNYLYSANNTEYKPQGA